MFQAHDVEIAAHNSQVEDDNRTNFIIRMKQLTSHKDVVSFGMLNFSKGKRHDSFCGP